MNNEHAATVAYIRRALLALPEVAAWPALRSLIERLQPGQPFGLLAFPALGARAMNASAEAAWPGAGALFCLHTSIHLVDDMIDGETTGLYRRIGEGETANLALAFQAAGLRIIDGHPIHPARKRTLLAQLAAAATNTAFGQALDAIGVDDEPGYWRVAEQKTPPLFETALSVGALLGGATVAMAHAIGRLGYDIGIMIQVSDDLGDAMATPAQPDWQRPNGNLALLYARTAPHPNRERFRRLCAKAADPQALKEAQVLLSHSGAISYCCYHLAAAHRRAARRLDTLDVPNPAPLTDLLQHHVQPLASLLSRAGIEPPPGLLPP